LHNSKQRRRVVARYGIIQRFLITLAASVLFILSPLGANALELTVFTEPLPPVHYEEDGQIVGIATEIIEEIFRLAGYQSRIEIYPWKRSYHLVQKQKNQFIYTLNRTLNRESLFKWIGPILTKRTYLYKFRGREDIKLKNLEDAKKYVTAVILGHSLTTRMEELGFEENINIVKTPNKSIQTKVFLNRRCDLITGNEYTIYRALKSVDLKMSDVEPALFISESGYYLGAHPETEPDIVKRLQNGSDQLQQSKFSQQIIEKYMSR
jgi:polar amino acid transport system substrate-binding protein